MDIYVYDMYIYLYDICIYNTCIPPESHGLLVIRVITCMICIYIYMCIYMYMICIHICK